MPPIRHVLVVEDDPRFALEMRRLLEQNSYRVTVATDVASAFAALAQARFHLVLLDLKLGNDYDAGLEICRELRAREKDHRTPIIILTHSSSDTVLLLDVCADDYVTKPYDPSVLLARMRARLRDSQDEPLLIDEDFEIYPKQYVVRRRRKGETELKEVALSPREFDLLTYMAKNGGRPYGRQMLLSEVWQEVPESIGPRVIDVTIARLREKLEDDPSNPRYILTVHRLGYKFREW